MTNLPGDNDPDAADISLPGNFELAQISIQNRKIQHFQKVFNKTKFVFRKERKEKSVITTHLNLKGQ